jgi:hypothetical protein
VAVPRRRLAVTVNASQPRATINAAWLRLLPSPMGEAVPQPPLEPLSKSEIRVLPTCRPT